MMINITEEKMTSDSLQDEAHQVHCLFHRDSTECCYCFPPSVSSWQAGNILRQRYMQRTKPDFVPISRPVFAPMLEMLQRGHIMKRDSTLTDSNTNKHLSSQFISQPQLNTGRQLDIIAAKEPARITNEPTDHRILPPCVSSRRELANTVLEQHTWKFKEGMLQNRGKMSCCRKEKRLPLRPLIPPLMKHRAVMNRTPVYIVHFMRHLKPVRPVP
jgi:hypothetical protein